MKKRKKWLIGLGAVLAAYLLYPNEEPKVVEPVKVEKKWDKKGNFILEKGYKNTDESR